MKYIIVSIGCLLMFAQCRSVVDVQPASSYDTLGVTWMTIERENIKYYFQGTGVKAASLYTDMHEEAYKKLHPVFNAKLPRKLSFFVWTDWVLAEQVLDHFPGFALPEECVCHVRASQTLGHEMTHVLVYWSDGIPPNSYSRFINEGVAVAFDLAQDNKIETAKEAMAGMNMPGIREIWTGSYEPVDDILYPLGGAFMDFLYKKNQPEKFMALIKNQQIEDAEVIYGKEELNTLINEFEDIVGL
ncbi:MAG: hypothetical protein K8F30_02485 [Taibaiella sp.]|nr:hypothetical protein [Taibaiella sp.]